MLTRGGVDKGYLGNGNTLYVSFWHAFPEFWEQMVAKDGFHRWVFQTQLSDNIRKSISVHGLYVNPRHGMPKQAQSR